MLKKAKAESDTGDGSKASDLADKILKSSHNIWLAGLGAFAKAQQEGSKVFETLVRQGVELEQNTRQAASQTAAVAREAAMNKAKEMQQMAGGTWDKLEQVFEDRVARALSKLGVYTQNDVQRLSDRVEELGQAVNKLLQSQAAQRRASGAAASAPGQATKRTAAKKRPAKGASSKTEADNKVEAGDTPARAKKTRRR